MVSLYTCVLSIIWLAPLYCNLTSTCICGRGWNISTSTCIPYRAYTELQLPLVVYNSQICHSLPGHAHSGKNTSFSNTSFHIVTYVIVSDLQPSYCFGKEHTTTYCSSTHPIFWVRLCTVATVQQLMHSVAYPRYRYEYWYALDWTTICPCLSAETVPFWANKWHEHIVL